MAPSPWARNRKTAADLASPTGTVAPPVTEAPVDVAHASTGTRVYTGVFRRDKIVGKGEDADPFAIATEDRTVLGVFDGLGGAGAEVYETQDGPRTGASIGAAVAAYAAREAAATASGATLATALHDHIASRLQAALARLTTTPSGLKGKLVRKLPSTVAVLEVSNDPSGAGRICRAFWAGDSRLYVLDLHGLRQLSRDHLSTDHDAMENLIQDAELRNCARADDEFTIDTAETTVLRSGFVAIAATDGVFGYLPTPMHFEALLLDTLAETSSFREWTELLTDRIAAVTQDDASLAFAAVGWEDQPSLSRALAPRRATLREQVSALDAAASRARAAREEAAALTSEFELLRARLWDDYRLDYEVRPDEQAHR